MVELARAMSAMPAKETDDLERLAIQDLHLLVAAVRYIKELLLLVG